MGCVSPGGIELRAPVRRRSSLWMAFFAAADARAALPRDAGPAPSRTARGKGNDRRSPVRNASGARRLVHAGLEVVRLAGIAENRPLALNWVRPLLHDAAGSRQEAEILLWEPGFSPPEATRTYLELAISRYTAVLSMQDTIEHGWNLIDEAMEFLPSFAPLLRKSLQMESCWRTAIQETRDLYAFSLSTRSSPRTPPRRAPK